MVWDQYFHDLCVTVAKKSPCLSRQIGAILVRDKSIVATGYNGPPRGCDHCDRRITVQGIPQMKCPRKFWGYKSGEGLEHCPAVHAEMNAVIAAARIGASTLGSTLYMNCVIPCKQCMGILINAGVKEIVVDSTDNYDDLVDFLKSSDNYPIVRKFEL